ncbi:MAG TPA: PAS domain S-box protein [Acidobacteriota bacterium]|jgi:PAS domain S-box-containing protein
MNAALQQLREQYISALQIYLEELSEASLRRAYELGRQAVAENIGILDFVRIHHETLEQLSTWSRTLKEPARAGKAAAEFFAECLSPYEMTHRGFREANDTLRQLNEMLERRAFELAAAIRGLENEISERRRAESALRRQSMFVELLRSVAVAANEASSFEDAARICLERICTFVKWPVGHLYVPSKNSPDVLEPSTTWYFQSAQRFETFRRITEATPLASGIGLPGRVLATRKPAWITDVTKDSNFPRAKLASDVGVKAGFGFPVLAGDKIVGVLEFFSEEAIEPDSELLEVIENIGTQLARVGERKRAEEALRDSEMKFRSVAQSAVDAILSADSEGNITFWNNAAREIFGYSEEQVLGKPLTFLMPARPREDHASGIERFMGTGESRLLGKTIELSGLRKNGMEFPLELSLTSWKAGSQVFFTAILRDISERRRAEEELHRLMRRNELILNSAGEGISGVDREGNTTFMNPAAARMTGWKVEELIGRPQHEMLHHSRADGLPYPREECPLMQTLSDGTVHHIRDEVFWRKNGTAFVVDGASTPIRDEHGRLVGAVETFRDVTERREAEKSVYRLSGRLLQLQDEERRRMARELHDTTGQTLAALAVNLSLVDTSTTKLDKRARKAFSEAKELVEECSREIRTLSYLLHPPMLEELGLAAALRWYADGFSKRSGIHVDLEVPSEEARLQRAAELALFRIVQEGLTNIHRHSGSATAQVRLVSGSDQVILEIQDQGRGIGKGEMDLSSDGIPALGVGIAGMRERVRQLGGRLEILSSKQGTTVKAVLPVGGERPEEGGMPA